MIRRLAVLACAVALVGCAGGDDGEAPGWNHDPADTDVGPQAWGEIDESFEQCLAGDRQSPVDIADAVPADLAPLEFDYPVAPVVIENTGHTIEVPMAEGGAHTLTIGGDEYRLAQFHFHAPSEHTLAGRSYDAEVHLVHEAEQGALAVVAILLDRGEPPSALVDLVVDSAPEDAGGEVEVEGARSPLELIAPLDAPAAAAGSYHTYPGSLTTPGCTEGVRWIVLPATLGISETATERLHELIGGFPGYDGYENNNRPTQPLNDRVIQRDRG